MGLRSTSDLNNIRLAPGQHTMSLEVRAEMRDIPILRSIQRDRTVSQTRILNTDRLTKLMRELGDRAGYRDTLSPLALRIDGRDMLDGKYT